MLRQVHDTAPGHKKPWYSRLFRRRATYGCAMLFAAIRCYSLLFAAIRCYSLLSRLDRDGAQSPPSTRASGWSSGASLPTRSTRR
jgi:hypothetical protein